MDAAILKAFLDNLVRDPLLFPIYDANGKLLKTYCNIGLRQGAQFHGCHLFDDVGLDAEAEIFSILRSGQFVDVTGPQASIAANEGKFVVGDMSPQRLHEQHAHVVNIYPGPMVLSGSLGHLVPVCANVGKGNPTADLSPSTDGNQTKPNWVCAVSQAFPIVDGECDYWIWKGS